MANKIFLDSDVIIDFFTDRQPFANPASELFELSEKKEVQLYISALSMTNIYYIVRKYLGHEKTLAILIDLSEMIEILGTSKKEIIQALHSKFNDFEDSVQYFTAYKESEIQAIITRNIKDYKHSSIAALTPTDYLKLHSEK